MSGAGLFSFKTRAFRPEVVLKIYSTSFKNNT